MIMLGKIKTLACFVIFAALLSAHTLQAQFIDIPMTQIENADLICQNSKLLFAFDMQNDKYRIWQGDPSLTDLGFELHISNAWPLACPYCYVFQVSLVTNNQTLDMGLVTDLDESGYFLTAWMAAEDGVEKFDLRCHSVN